MPGNYPTGPFKGDRGPLTGPATRQLHEAGLPYMRPAEKGIGLPPCGPHEKGGPQTKAAPRSAEPKMKPYG